MKESVFDKILDSKRQAGALMSYAYTSAQVVVNLIYVPMLLGVIGKSEYGLFQMIGSIISYLNVINTTLAAGATRYYCKYYAVNNTDGMANTLGTLKRIYRYAGALCLITAGVLSVVLRFVYAKSLNSWELTEGSLLVLVLAINLIVTMNNTISIAVISAHEEFAFLKGTMLLTVVIQPFLVLLLVKYYPFALTVCLVQLALNTLCRTVQHTYAERQLGMDSRLRWRDAELERGLLKFSGGIVLAAVADQIFWKADQLILGYMYGTQVVAVYAVGAQIITAYSPLGTAVSSVFMPRVSEMWHRDHNLDDITELFIRVSRIALYPLLAVLTGFAVFGNEFITLWAGEGFTDAYWVALLVMIPFTIDVSQNIGLTILQVMNLYSFRAKMYVLAACGNIILTIALVSRYGCIGAAASSGVAMAISSGLVLNIYYTKIVGLDMVEWWKSIVRETIPLIVLCIASIFIWHRHPIDSVYGLIVSMIIYAVLFCLTAWNLSASTTERKMIASIARRLKKSAIQK